MVQFRQDIFYGGATKMEFCIVYIAAVSIAAIAVTAADKRCAKSKKRRVPERTLFFIAAIGGAAAMYITMKLIRHKTKHKRFMIGLPVIMLVQVGLIGLIIFSSQNIINMYLN